MVINKNDLHQNKNREQVNNREIRYLPDLSIVILLYVFVLVQRILNDYPNYPYFRRMNGIAATGFHYFAGKKK